MAPLGRWYRSPNGSKTENADSQHGQAVGLQHETSVQKPLITQEDLELEYLNEISRLTREKEDARDEIERQIRDNEAMKLMMRESSRSLESKVAELEAKLSEAGSTPSKAANVSILKAKLEKYDQMNRALHTKIQKLKQRRKEYDDDFSEVSSVGSLSLLSLQTKSSTTQIANSLLDLQIKYDKELAKIKELERRLQAAETNKNDSQKLLDELKVESAEAEKKYRQETENLQDKLQVAKKELITLRATQSKGDISNDQILTDFEKSQLKVLDLEKEIADEKRVIEVLEAQVKVNEESEKKVERLLIQIDEFKDDINEKGKLIENLNGEKLRSERELTAIKESLRKSKEREDKVQQELEELKSDIVIERCKVETVENTAEDTKQAKELKVALDALQKQFAEETLLNASLKEELKQLAANKSIGNVTNFKDKENNLNEIVRLKAELESRNDQLSTMTTEMEKIENERDTSASALQAIETSLVETKLKNAKLMEELDTLKLQLRDNNESNNKSIQGQRSSVDYSKIVALQKAVTKKDMEIKVLRAETQDVSQLTETLKKMEIELAKKTKELKAIESEKYESAKRLETLESDFAITQQKGAKTWEELEDLREKYQIEQKLKENLQGQLKRVDSVDKIVGETKRLSQATLKDRDKEIDKLKKQLIEANIAKQATEKKLTAYKNDSAAQENSREVIKQQLEEQLQTENEKAMHLENLIVSKEEDIERIRSEFDILIKNTQNELQKKRNQVTDLNGEVLVKANELALKDRDLQYLKSEIDDLKLQHSSEVAHLNKELDSSVDKVELERLRKQNEGLEQTILTLNQEVGKLRAIFVNQSASGNTSSEGQVKVLRARNEKLKKDIEKLALKLYEMKKGQKESQRIDRKKSRRTDRKKSQRIDREKNKRIDRTEI